MKSESTGQALARPSESQELARVVQGEIVTIATPSLFNLAMATWQKQGLKVLTPVISLSTIPQDHQIIRNDVQINPVPERGEVYFNPLFCKPGEVALGKAGLEKIAQGAGISIDRIERVDSGTVDHLYTYRVYGWWLSFDGARVDRVATKTLDLRDGSPDLKGFTANQITQTRRHGEAICESKAINRLYRQYGVRQKYTQEELATPFIVLKLHYSPDMTNPIVAAVYTQLKSGATRLFFPGGIDVSSVDPLKLPEHARPKGEPQEVTDPDEDQQTLNGTARLATAAAPEGLQDFDDAPAQTDDEWETVTVAHVGLRGSDNHYYVTLDDQRVLITPDRGLAGAANEARKGRKPIRVRLGPRNGQYIELVETGGLQTTGGGDTGKY